MKSEIERYKEAVELARNELFALATLGGITSVGNVQAKEALAKINAILNPPPEYEEVEESAGWVNIYSAKETAILKTKVSHAYPTRSLADDNAKDTRIACEELKYKVKRLKPVPVERSVSGEVRWETHQGFTVPSGPNIDWEALLHKTGYLTFTWAE